MHCTAQHGAATVVQATLARLGTQQLQRVHVQGQFPLRDHSFRAERPELGAPPDGWVNGQAVKVMWIRPTFAYTRGQGYRHALCEQQTSVPWVSAEQFMLNPCPCLSTDHKPGG